MRVGLESRSHLSLFSFPQPAEFQILLVLGGGSGTLLGSLLVTLHLDSSCLE